MLILTIHRNISLLSGTFANIGQADYWPSSASDEELQLLLALEMSKEEAKVVENECKTVGKKLPSALERKAHINKVRIG